jgi:hypothetical protein
VPVLIRFAEQQEYGWIPRVSGALMFIAGLVLAVALFFLV